MNSSRLGGWLTVIGAAGIVVITGLYAAATPVASVPLPAGAGYGAAMYQSAASIGLLQAAGTVGLVADMLLIGGALLLVLRPGQNTFNKLFWLWLMLSTVVFIVVDAIAGLVLPRLIPTLSAEIGGYAFARGLFDACFAYGVLVFGGAFLALALERSRRIRVRGPALVIGVLSVLAFALHIAGWTVPLLFGLCVGLAGIMGIYLGWLETREPG